MNLIVIIIFIAIVYLCYYKNSSKEKFFPYPNDYIYAKEHETPNKLNKKIDKRCKNKFLLNAVCYPDMNVCQRECRKYSPNGLQNNNYCLDNYNGEVECYPSTW